MTTPRKPPLIISAVKLLAEYRQGHFPMAETRDDENVYWLDPEWRGILPIQEFRTPKRLARSMRSSSFTVTVDRAFDHVISQCAAIGFQRTNTWINPLIERSYVNLFAKGHAHSVEVWDDEELIGGLYGVSIGGAFFGESMFSRRTDASKVALVHLAARLKAGGYTLLDSQFITEHLKQFGAMEIERTQYKKMLAAAVETQADFYVLGGTGAVLAAGAVLQLITQTS
jgi:leucyl/phenylalanyl-tRNA---protein transferase